MNTQSSASGQDLYSFREFTLDVSDRRLTRGTCPVHLPPKTYDVLVVLIRRAGRLVTKHELLESIWPSVFVGEGTHASTSYTATAHLSEPPAHGVQP